MLNNSRNKFSNTQLTPHGTLHWQQFTSKISCNVKVDVIWFQNWNKIWKNLFFFDHFDCQGFLWRSRQNAWDGRTGKYLGEAALLEPVLPPSHKTLRNFCSFLCTQIHQLDLRISLFILLQIFNVMRVCGTGITLKRALRHGMIYLIESNCVPD